MLAWNRSQPPVRHRTLARRPAVEPLEGRTVLSWAAVPPATVSLFINAPNTVHFNFGTGSAPSNGNYANTTAINHNEVDYYSFAPPAQRGLHLRRLGRGRQPHQHRGGPLRHLRASARLRRRRQPQHQEQQVHLQPPRQYNLLGRRHQLQRVEPRLVQPAHHGARPWRIRRYRPRRDRLHGCQRLAQRHRPPPPALRPQRQ